MPVKRGDTKIISLYRGSVEILKRYRTLQLVYSSVMPTDPTIPVIIIPSVVRDWRIIASSSSSGSTINSGTISSGDGTSSSRAAAQRAITNWLTRAPSNPSSPWQNVHIESDITLRSQFTAGGRRIYSPTISSGSGTANSTGAANAAISNWRSGASPNPSGSYTDTDHSSQVTRRVIPSSGTRFYSPIVNSSGGAENSQAAASIALLNWRRSRSPSPSGRYTNTEFSTSITPYVISSSRATSGIIDSASGNVSLPSLASAAINDWRDSNPGNPQDPYTYTLYSTTLTQRSDGSYDWAVHYRYAYTLVVTGYKWSGSYRYYYISPATVVYDWSASYRYYYTTPNLITIVYDWVASYYYSRRVVSTTTTYRAQWTAPLTGAFTRYRIERTTRSGNTALSDIILAANIVRYNIGTVRRRVRIRAERPADSVVGPWSNWIS